MCCQVVASAVPGDAVGKKRRVVAKPREHVSRACEPCRKSKVRPLRCSSYLPTVYSYLSSSYLSCPAKFQAMLEEGNGRERRGTEGGLRETGDLMHPPNGFLLTAADQVRRDAPLHPLPQKRAL